MFYEIIRSNWSVNLLMVLVLYENKAILELKFILHEI